MMGAKYLSLSRYLPILSLIISGCVAGPVSQPGYASTDYTGAQSLVPQQQQQSQQPLYISIPRTPTPQPPVYTGAQAAYTPPTHVVPQLILPTNVDRQIQRVASRYAGPAYADVLAIQQQQGLANQVQASAERRAAWQGSRQRADIVAANEAIIRANQERQYTAAQTPHIQYQPQPQAQYRIQTAVLPTAPKLEYQPQPIYATHRSSEESQPVEEEAYDDANASYKFGFDVTDDENTNYHNRQEQKDGKKISGSYSVVDSDGFIRTVTYTADPKEGFKAEVVRKPTDIVVKIPKPTAAPQAKERYIQEQKNVLYQYE